MSEQPSLLDDLPAEPVPTADKPGEVKVKPAESSEPKEVYCHRCQDEHLPGRCPFVWPGDQPKKTGPGK